MEQTMFMKTKLNCMWSAARSSRIASKARRPDGSFMPILLPCTPPEFCTSNMTKGTFKKIREELMRGYALTKADHL
uniref:Uncharacterized protein n=1 Tax=Oryza nivara TaxID=4536 RepID=A0A0E0IUZ5_ORYNI